MWFYLLTPEVWIWFILCGFVVVEVFWFEGCFYCLLDLLLIVCFLYLGLGLVVLDLIWDV